MAACACVRARGGGALYIPSRAHGAPRPARAPRAGAARARARFAAMRARFAALSRRFRRARAARRGQAAR